MTHMLFANGQWVIVVVHVSPVNFVSVALNSTNIIVYIVCRADVEVLLVFLLFPQIFVYRKMKNSIRRIFLRWKKCQSRMVFGRNQTLFCFSEKLHGNSNSNSNFCRYIISTMVGFFHSQAHTNAFLFLWF